MQPLADAPDFAVLHRADMPSSTHASPHSSPARRARIPRCVQRAPSRDDRASVYTSYTSLARHAGNAGHAKGGKCCHSPPPRALRTCAPSRDHRASVCTFYTSLANPLETPDTRRAESAATPRPRAPCAPSRDYRASVCTSYTSLANPLETPDTRRAGNGPSHSPPPLRVQLEPLARQRLRSA